jgi:lipoprotein-anchoring transpeptidase ErfK/SrfK
MLTMAMRIAPGQPVADMYDFSSVVLPWDIGQSSIQAFVPETKHTVRGLFLDYWRANGAAAVYGNPISEPFASPSGYYSQAFDNAIFEYHPEYEGTDEPLVRMAPVGSSLIADQTSNLNRDRRRQAGGGDPRGSIWLGLEPGSNAVKRALDDGGFYSEATGHTVNRDFANWYNAHEGAYYLGNPLSQAYRTAGVTMQHFECGAMMRQGSEIKLAPVGRRGAELLGVDFSPVERNDLPTFKESLFTNLANPSPAGGDLNTPGRKWIEVSLSQQRLWAYQADEAVLTTLVSTGLGPNPTEIGTFRIRMKFESQDMSGFESRTGEVVGLGDTPVANATRWEVKNVPNVMYVNSQAEALHGAYWHNNFGNRMSHGCINLPIPVSAFMFGWAPIGTMVWVHE